MNSTDSPKKENVPQAQQNGKNWQRFLRRLLRTNQFFFTLSALVSAAGAWLWYSCGNTTGIWNPIKLVRQLQLYLQLPDGYRGLSQLKGLQLIILQKNGGRYAVALFMPLVMALAALLLYSLLGGLVRLASTAVANSRSQRQTKALARIEQEAREHATADLAELDRRNTEQARRLAELSEDITNLSPNDPDVHLEAEDPQLQGISSAVNDLVARMNESYRQQVRFVSDASHELRTPIAVIKGYADMLDRWGTEDESVLREGIAAIKSEADNMNRLVEQLLFLARGDSGRTQLQLQSVSLTDLMRELYSE